MIDFLFKLNVILTALSTIFSETRQWLGNLGGIWFHVFTAWIIYSFTKPAWKYIELHSLELSSIITAGFLLANLFLCVIQYDGPKRRIASYINTALFKQLVLFVQYITFIFIVWTSTYSQISTTVDCAFKILLEHTDDNLFLWLKLITSAVLLGLLVVMVHAGAEKQQDSRTRRTSSQRRRSSARIQALQQQQQRAINRQKSSSGKRRGSRSR